MGAPNSQICQATWQLFVIGTMCQSLHCFAGPQTCSNMHGIELCLVRHLQCLRQRAVGIAVPITSSSNMLEIFLAKLGTRNRPLIPNFAEALHSLGDRCMWSIRRAKSDLRTKHLTHLDSLIQASWLLYTKLCWTHLLLLPALVWHNLLKQEVMDMWRNSSGVLAANFRVDLMAQNNVRTSEPFPCAKSCKPIYIIYILRKLKWIPGYLWMDTFEKQMPRKVLKVERFSELSNFDPRNFRQLHAKLPSWSLAASITAKCRTWHLVTRRFLKRNSDATACNTSGTFAVVFRML